MRNVARAVASGLFTAWLIGCGGAPAAAPVSATATPSSGAEEEGIDDGVEVRLGCTLVTRAEIDRELARPRDVGTEASSREAARAIVVRRRVAIRLMHEWLHTDLGPDEVEQTMQNVAAGNGVSVDELRAELARRGMDESRYRDGLADLLRAQRIADSSGAIDASELAAEVERRMVSSPGATRDVVRAAVAQERILAIAEAAITRRLEELQALRAYAGYFGCAER